MTEVNENKPIDFGCAFSEHWQEILCPSYLDGDSDPCCGADHFLFPLCRDNHWILFVADMRRKRVYYFNSISPADSLDKDMKFFARVFEYLLRSIHQLNPRRECNLKFQPRLPHHVKQRDGFNCGVFVMFYMEAWTGHVPDAICTKMSNVTWLDKIRRKVCAGILLNESNIRRENIERLVNERDAAKKKKAGKHDVGKDKASDKQEEESDLLADFRKKMKRSKACAKEAVTKPEGKTGVKGKKIQKKSSHVTKKKK